MIVTYDCEFLDDGRTIELISIALVAEDGREYYGVVEDADLTRVMRLPDPWVWNNVVLKHLPVIEYDSGGVPNPGWIWDDEHPDFERVLGRKAIARDVEAFLRGIPEPELWAYYSATDHVAGYQLFGSMIEASEHHGWPMRTSCLKQEEESIKRQIRRHLGATPGSPESVRALAVSAIGDWTYRRPEQDEATEHHALHDARHDMALARWLELA